MLKVPFYTQQNYRSIIEKEYGSLNTSDWVDFGLFVKLWSDDFLSPYASRDARKLSSYLSDSSLSGTIQWNGKSYSRKDLVIASKLLMPTPRTSDYFFWNIEQGTHTGIDILMPQGTPIPSFTAGKVVRIKHRDGVKKDEGNCVVVKSPAGFYYGYKHLDTIAVKDAQEVTKGTVLGTCGSTGQSTQYHLHFQVDSKDTPFYPYRSNVLGSIKRYTLNPLHVLQSQLGVSGNDTSPARVGSNDVFVDMPNDATLQKAFRALYAAEILKGNNGKILPDDYITRQQAALLMHRIAARYNIYQNLPIKQPTFQPYTDITSKDPEVLKAIKNMQYYGIMGGKTGIFQPFKTVVGEEWVALLARMCYGIQDSPSGNWYDSYMLYFQTKKILTLPWGYLGKPIVRKEAFLIVYKVLKDKGYIRE